MSFSFPPQPLCLPPSEFCWSNNTVPRSVHYHRENRQNSSRQTGRVSVKVWPLQNHICEMVPKCHLRPTESIRILRMGSGWLYFGEMGFRKLILLTLVVVWSPSRIQIFARPWPATLQASLSFTISWSLLRLMSIESVMPSNHLILCCTLLLLSANFPSIRVFSNEPALHTRWPKYWSFSFSPSNDYLGLISFRIHWLDLLAVQRDSQESFPMHHFFGT